MTEDSVQALIRAEAEWSRAMVRNDAEAIGRYIADDWTIIGPDGSMSDRPAFLRLVASGELTHDVMEMNDLDVRVYGDAAVVTGIGVSGGRFRGQAFHVVERASDVWIRRDGSWLCVSTHLTRIADGSAEPGE